MCNIVDDFWTDMNRDELDCGRPSLPKLCVAPGVGDETDKPAKAKQADKGAPQSFQMRATSIYSTEVDDTRFSEAGFNIGVRIQRVTRSGDKEAPAPQCTIKKIDGQDVTVKCGDDETTMKRSEIFDGYRTRPASR